MRGKGRLHWLLVCCLGACAAAVSAGTLVGIPPFASFTPDLDVYPQNFAVAQDSRGIVYVGNTNGVLEFDGERWALTVLDNREMVRSLAVAADDRVYVGGYNTFGYLQPDATGSTHYVDLTGKYRDSIGDREFADIWDTLVTPDGVYFRALRDVFFWDPHADTVLHWHHEQRFGTIAYHDGETLLQFRGKGFRRRQGAAWADIPATAGMVDLVFDLLPLADGSLLSLGVSGDWNILSADNLQPASMPNGLPPSSTFQSATVLADGSIVLASGDGVVYIVDPTRTHERHFKLDAGYLSEVTATGDGGFLVSGNQSIYRIAWPTTWTVLGTEEGADGTLQHLRQWNGNAYLLSSAGMLKVISDKAGIPRFERLPWAGDSCYDLIEVDAERALLADSHKLSVVSGSSRRDLVNELVYPRAFFRSRFRAGRIYVGTEVGLRFVDDLPAGLVLSAPAESTLEVRVSTLVEVSPEEIWFGSERHGIWRARLDHSGKIVEQRRFGAADGLLLGAVPAASIVQINDGTLIASTNLGFFRLDGERFVPEDLSGLAALRVGEEQLRIAQAQDGVLWAYGINRILRLMPAAHWQEQNIRGMGQGALESIELGSDGSATFVATLSLLFYDSAIDGKPTLPKPGVRLRSVALIQADGRREPLPIAPTAPIELAYGNFGLAFQFALPDLAQPRLHAYQGRLLGYESEFSPWSSTRGYTYSRLSPGAYTFEVRGRDSNDAISTITPYRLVILAPWYRTFLAYSIALALGLAILVWVTRETVRRRTHRLAADKLRLEATVADRTRDLAAANQRLEAMAHLDGLTGIANRRRLDEYLATVWAQARERRQPVSVLAIDVDHFKRYNDSHGHLAGDQLLKALVPRLAHCLRRGEDLLARYGGEEFLAVLPGADVNIAAAMAEAMRNEIDQAQIGATVSIGVASAMANTADVTELVRAADSALYDAKDRGRNRIAISPSNALP